MKSIIEQQRVRRRVRTTQRGAQPLPVIGRHCRSSLKRLKRAFRDGRPAVMLVSHSRFAPGYVVDTFLARIDADTTVIRVAQPLDDPGVFLDELVRSIGFESPGAKASNLDQVLRLFLRYQKMHRRRTILAISDVDTHGPEVLAKIRELIDDEIAREHGLMILMTGPANDLLDPLQPILDALSAGAGERIVLTPFALSETREFIRERFEQGRPGDDGEDVGGPTFDFHAAGLIHELSSGVLETIDLLCRKALEIAARKNQAVISPAGVKAAARLVGLIPFEPDAEPELPVLTEEEPADSSGHLVVKVRGAPARTIELDGNLLVGRDELCDICLDDVQVSRHHGLFARATDGLYYIDLRSTNGSGVNGQPAGRLALQNNDVIAIGDVRIIYSVKRAEADADADLDVTDTFEMPKHADDAPMDDVGPQREP